MPEATIPKNAGDVISSDMAPFSSTTDLNSFKIAGSLSYRLVEQAFVDRRVKLLCKLRNYDNVLNNKLLREEIIKLQGLSSRELGELILKEKIAVILNLESGTLQNYSRENLKTFISQKILQCVTDGDEKVAKKLLQLHPAALLDNGHRRGLTPFQEALTFGDDEMVEMMLPFFDQLKKENLLENVEHEISTQFCKIFPLPIGGSTKDRLDYSRNQQREEVDKFIYAFLDPIIELIRKVINSKYYRRYTYFESRRDLDRETKELDDLVRRFISTHQKFQDSNITFNPYYILKTLNAFEEVGMVSSRFRDEYMPVFQNIWASYKPYVPSCYLQALTREYKLFSEDIYKFAQPSPSNWYTEMWCKMRNIDTLERFEKIIDNKNMRLSRIIKLIPLHPQDMNKPSPQKNDDYQDCCIVQ